MRDLDSAVEANIGAAMTRRSLAAGDRARPGPDWIFQPRLLPTLATLVLLPLLCGLGYWQLERAAQKQNLVDEFEARQQAPPIARLPESAAAFDALRFRSVRLQGRFDNAHTLLLDNRTHSGQAGYHVYTPLRSANGAGVLVNRGWIPLRDRRRLPTVPAREGPQTIVGRLDHAPNPGLRLQPELPASLHWPLRLQTLVPAELAPRIGYELAPLVVLEQATAGAGRVDAGFVREWPTTSLRPQRHLAYALQWFALALSLLVVFLVVNLRRR